MMRMDVLRIAAIILFIAIMVPQVSSAQSARTETIAAVVNEDAVSESDVSDRMKLIMVSSGMPNNQEIRDRIRPRIVNMLIDEKLKLQEAQRLEIEIDENEIEQGFASIASRNSFSSDQFRRILRKEGVSPKTLEDQVRSEIAWSRVIKEKIRPQVIITDNEADAVIQRLEMNRGKTEFRVFEIFLPVEKPSEESNVRNLSDRLTRQLIEQRAPFQRIASQFSQAAGAANGGDMGWVQEGQLPEALDEVLSRMNKGEISKPIRSLAGYHILYLREKRVMTADTMPSRDEVMNRLGMERIDRLQRSYLLDLKADAFIEQRA